MTTSFPLTSGLKSPHVAVLFVKLIVEILLFFLKIILLLKTTLLKTTNPNRHCERSSDEAICVFKALRHQKYRLPRRRLLAMTTHVLYQQKYNIPAFKK
ncbi:MAG TPA: hypothetical protein VEC36_02800 [Patescibacteria group bacterium]|nr:hypothetical protein [Patescibacteria group bacterium]